MSLKYLNKLCEIIKDDLEKLKQAGYKYFIHGINTKNEYFLLIERTETEKSNNDKMPFVPNCIYNKKSHKLTFHNVLDLFYDSKYVKVIYSKEIKDKTIVIDI